MSEYRIVTKIDPEGVVAGRAKVKQELQGMEADANRATKAVDGVTASTARASAASLGAGQSASRLASEAQLAARAATLQARSFDAVTTGARASTLAMRETLVVARELGRGNWTRLPGSLTLLAQGVGTSGGLSAYIRQLLTMAGAITTVRDAELAEEAVAAAASAAALRSAVEQAQASVMAADTKVALAEASIRAAESADAEALAQTKLAEAMASVSAASEETIIAQNALAVAQDRAAVAAEADAAATSSAMTGVGLTLGLVAVAAAALGVAYLVLRDKNAALNEEIDKAVDKLEKDEHQTEVTRAAKERFSHTVSGLKEALDAEEKALKGIIDTEFDAAQKANIAAQNDAIRTKGVRDQTVALLENAKAQIERDKNIVFAAGTAGSADPMRDALSEQDRRRVDELQHQLDEANTLAGRADTQLQESRRALAIDIAEKYSKEASTPEGRTNAAFDAQRKAVEGRLGAEIENTKELSKQIEIAHELDRELTKIEIARQAALAAERKRTTEYGTFRSREQAIVMAGRELQRDHLSVSENYQFGGVHANHPGMGNDAHGKYAIDVNAGAGVTEANVPDLNARFSELARRYQARGFRVLWNGQVYEANGNGPSHAIPGGENQHRDHMHVEAPQSIIGKPTGAAGESEAIKEENKAQTTAQRMSDFVQNVVDEAATKGLPPGQENALQAQINKKIADFTREFHTPPSKGQRDKITTALTDAQAREISQHFTDAYVTPLDKLRQLQDQTGLSRAILNAQIDESIKLGRPLTDVEKQEIDNFYRTNDQMEREKGILEDIRGPLDEYAAQLKALNDLLAKGAITHEAYNAKVLALGAGARNTIKDLPGVDPGTGKAYGDVAAIGDENQRYAEQLNHLKDFKQAYLDMGLSYDALIEAAAKQHAQNLNKIDQARRDVSLDAMTSIAGSITSIMQDAFGKQSKIARAAFAAEKAVAIARAIISIQTGIAEAAALPFPANLPAIASVIAATASIVANIRAVTVGPGYKAGGYTGSGPVDAVAGVVHGQEFVMNADATSKFGPLLEKMNDGTLGPASGGPVSAAASAAAVGAATGAQTSDQLQGATLERIAVATEKMQKDIHMMAHPSTKDRLLDVFSIVSPVTGGIAKALFGHKDGGWTGDGPVNAHAGLVHGQEFVVKSPFAGANRALLEAINSGAQVGQIAAGHAAQAAGGGGVQQPIVVPAPEVTLRVVNVDDKSRVADFFTTPEGEQLFVNMLHKQPEVIKQLAGGQP